jgi:putative hemolysin
MDAWQLALVAGLIVLNAAFAGSELALVSLREAQLRRLSRRGRAGRALDQLARDPNRFLATIQIGITLAGFLASAIAAIALAEPLVEPLEFLGAAAEPMAVVSVTLVLTFLTLVLGELAPKRVAMQRAERWALVAARPLAGLAAATRPLVWLLGWATDVVVRVLGGDPGRGREEVSEEELRDLLVSRREFTPEQRTIISGVFDIADRTLRHVLVPRRRMVTVGAEQQAPEALAILAASGRSRAPVVGCDVDDITGVAHWHDLVGADGPVGPLARPALVLPETAGLLEALRRLRADRQQLAVVVDEYGAAAGIVTVEDLVEELVGEIYDQTDPHVEAAERLPDGNLLLDGTFALHDLVDLDVELPVGGRYTTVAGLVLDHLGRVPRFVGESVEVDDWLLEVAEIRGRAVTRVLLRRTAGGSSAPDPT